jgi:hypothetical protein
MAVKLICNGMNMMWSSKQIGHVKEEGRKHSGNSKNFQGQLLDMYYVHQIQFTIVRLPEQK